MQRWFQKILLLVAVVTVMGHSILPHFHHDETAVITNQHHHDEEQSGGKHHHDDESKDQEHGIFSFAQLDENFIPAKEQVKTFEMPVEYLPVVIALLSNKFSAVTKTHYGWYREYPPPDNYRYISSLRGPPLA